jgi:hypothetical protein
VRIRVGAAYAALFGEPEAKALSLPAVATALAPTPTRQILRF